MLTRSLLQPGQCNVRRARYPEMSQVASAGVAVVGSGRSVMMCPTMHH